MQLLNNGKLKVNDVSLVAITRRLKFWAPLMMDSRPNIYRGNYLNRSRLVLQLGDVNYDPEGGAIFLGIMNQALYYPQIVLHYQPLTIAGWFKRTADMSGDVASWGLTYYISPYGDEFTICDGIFGCSDNTIALRTNDGTIDSGLFYPLNQWIHIVWVLNDSGIKLYVNGEWVQGVTGGFVCGIYGGLVLGRVSWLSPEDFYSPMTIRDFRLYNCMLDSYLISILYEMTKIDSTIKMKQHLNTIYLRDELILI